VYEETRKKLVNTSENAQRREILPVDTSTARALPTSDTPRDLPKDLSCVLPAHLSKLHPLVAAFMLQNCLPPKPFFNAVSDISLDDLSLAL
jgi:RsiW-degrading membrane proteinase PrsW (M82 family)